MMRDAATLGNQRDGRMGFSLVEIAIAVLILAILAIGGAAFIYRSRVDIVTQQFKRAAIECANSNMEHLVRSEPYANLEARIGSPPLVEPVSLNGVSGFAMRSAVADGGAAADNCLRIVVSVEYRRGTGQTVSLETLRSK